MLLSKLIRSLAVVVALAATTTAFSADLRESFPPMEDFTNQGGQPIHRAIEGDPVAGRNAHGAFVAKKSTDSTFVYLKADENGQLITSSVTGFGADFTFGDVASSSTAIKIVRRTTYTEPTSQAQRSINSSSASDSSAGTGMRTIRIVYYTAAWTGPFTTDVTLNGTTAVNTSVSDIQYIEEMYAITVGSTGSNVGTITLYGSTGGGGGTVGTISATNNRTFWAHHYVATGKIANITGISAGSTSTTVGCGALFVMLAQKLDLANAADIQVSDFVRLYGQSSTFARAYQSPIKVTGPARLTVYVTPECSSATTYRASLDYFEP